MSRSVPNRSTEGFRHRTPRSSAYTNSGVGGDSGRGSSLGTLQIGCEADINRAWTHHRARQQPAPFVP